MIGVVFERFSLAARNAVQNAAEFARGEKSPEVLPKHFLWALLVCGTEPAKRLPPSRTEEVLRLLGAQPERNGDASVMVTLSSGSEALLAQACNISEAHAKELTDEWDLLESATRETGGRLWIALQHLIYAQHE